MVSVDWDHTSGTWLNIASVLLGTGVGLVLRHHLQTRFITVITQAVGLMTLFVGLTMANSLTRVPAARVDGVVLGLITTILGGLWGEWWQIEFRLAQLGEWIQHQVQGGGRFTEGFVTASLLFCVGPLTILGCLNNGLSGDNHLLVLKSTLDGFSAIALSSSLGIGVGFSSVVILVYQGGLSVSAGFLAQSIGNPSQNASVLLLTGVGGLIILAIGLNLLEIAKIRVASFLPALLLSPLMFLVFR